MKSITLSITNLDRLPDGGPLSFSSDGRPFEIGRDGTSDWTLPDPKLFISARHCEIRFDGQDYVLNDISRNGTFLNGALQRVKSPYRLQAGDQLAIGDYVIAVQIRDGRQQASGGHGSDAWMSAGLSAVPDDDDIWGAAAAGPAPVDRGVFKPKRVNQPVHPDFVDSHLDLPPARSSEDPFAPQQVRPTPGANPFAPASADEFPPSAQPGLPQAPTPLRPEGRAASAAASSDMPLRRFAIACARVRLPSRHFCHCRTRYVAGGWRSSGAHDFACFDPPNMTASSAHRRLGLLAKGRWLGLLTDATCVSARSLTYNLRLIIMPVPGWWKR